MVCVAMYAFMCVRMYGHMCVHMYIHIFNYALANLLVFKICINPACNFPRSAHGQRAHGPSTGSPAEKTMVHLWA